MGSRETFNYSDPVEPEGARTDGFELRGRFTFFVDMLKQIAEDLTLSESCEHRVATLEWLDAAPIRDAAGKPIGISYDLFCDMVDADETARRAIRSALRNQPEVIKEACLELRKSGADTDFDRMYLRMAGIDSDPSYDDQGSQHRLSGQHLMRDGAFAAGIR